MTDDQALKVEIRQLRDALLNVTRLAGQSAIATLSMHSHISALKTVLSSLDSRASDLWDEALAVEQDKQQRQIADLQLMLAGLQSSISKSVQ